jgi:glycine/D-amino acid oxidase-like deaminating enzyme
MNDPVDVLIIGAGASGAAVAWSLAETKMHIVSVSAFFAPLRAHAHARGHQGRVEGQGVPPTGARTA